MKVKNTLKNTLKIITVLLTITVVFLNYRGTGEVKAAETNDTVTLTGYLIDEHCFFRKSAEPGKDTIGCLFMTNCIKGGYGIAVPKNDGTYQFYYFDGKFITNTTNIDGTGGQKLAYDTAVKIRDKGERSGYLSVTVTGKLGGETEKSVASATVNYPVLNLETIEETKTETLTGYLIDEHCFEHKSLDPGKDTKECLLMDNCIKGGYGIAVPQTDGSYKFYYFNGTFFNDVTALNGTAGQKKAYDLINASTKTDHIAVTVKGAFAGVNKASINLQGVTYPTFDVINLAEATNEESANLQKIINAASSTVASGTVASGTVASSTVASSTVASGTVASGTVASKTVASGTVASDTQGNSDISKTCDSSSIVFSIVLFLISGFIGTAIRKKKITTK